MVNSSTGEGKIWWNVPETSCSDRNKILEKNGTCQKSTEISLKEQLTANAETILATK